MKLKFLHFVGEDWTGEICIKVGKMWNFDWNRLRILNNWWFFSVIRKFTWLFFSFLRNFVKIYQEFLKIFISFNQICQNLTWILRNFHLFQPNLSKFMKNFQKCSFVSTKFVKFRQDLIISCHFLSKTFKE